MKPITNRLFAPLKRIGLIAALLAAGCVSVPAFAGINVGIEIGIPPPPMRVEVVPPVPEGYVWAPGYWDYFQGQHVWRRGHFIEARPGYRWVPESWERHGDLHRFNQGHWDRDENYRGDRHDHGDRGHGRGHDDHGDHR